MTTKNHNNIIYVLFLFCITGLMILLGSLLKSSPIEEELFILDDFNIVEKNISGESKNTSMYAPIGDSADVNKGIDIDSLTGVLIEENSKTNVNMMSLRQKLKVYSDSIKKSLPEKTLRNDVILRYYPHKPDNNRIYGIKSLGFYVHERPSDSLLVELPSNVVYYGDGVNKKDIQLVSLYLLDNGFYIRKIAEARFHDGWKSNSIEIAHSPEFTNDTLLTLEDIKNFNNSWQTFCFFPTNHVLFLSFIVVCTTVLFTHF